MSYDVSAEIDTGGSEPVEVHDAGNYTYNVSPMYRRVIPGGLNTLHGMSCGTALPIVCDAIAAMRADPAQFIALNPENKWGNYEGALAFLVNIATMCERHPLAMVRVS